MNDAVEWQPWPVELQGLNGSSLALIDATEGKPELEAVLEALDAMASAGQYISARALLVLSGRAVGRQAGAAIDRLATGEARSLVRTLWIHERSHDLSGNDLLSEFTGNGCPPTCLAAHQHAMLALDCAIVVADSMRGGTVGRYSTLAPPLIKEEGPRKKCTNSLNDYGDFRGPLMALLRAEAPARSSVLSKVTKLVSAMIPYEKTLFFSTFLDRLTDAVCNAAIPRVPDYASPAKRAEWNKEFRKRVAWSPGAAGAAIDAAYQRSLFDERDWPARIETFLVRMRKTDITSVLTDAHSHTHWTSPERRQFTISKAQNAAIVTAWWQTREDFLLRQEAISRYILTSAEIGLVKFGIGDDYNNIIAQAEHRSATKPAKRAPPDLSFLLGGMGRRGSGTRAVNEDPQRKVWRRIFDEPVATNSQVSLDQISGLNRTLAQCWGRDKGDTDLQQAIWSALRTLAARSAELNAMDWLRAAAGTEPRDLSITQLPAHRIEGELWKLADVDLINAGDSTLYDVKTAVSKTSLLSIRINSFKQRGGREVIYIGVLTDSDGLQRYRGNQDPYTAASHRLEGASQLILGTYQRSRGLYFQQFSDQLSEEINSRKVLKAPFVIDDNDGQPVRYPAYLFEMPEHFWGAPEDRTKLIRSMPNLSNGRLCTTEALLIAIVTGKFEPSAFQDQATRIEAEWIFGALACRRGRSREIPTLPELFIVTLHWMMRVDRTAGSVSSLRKLLYGWTEHHVRGGTTLPLGAWDATGLIDRFLAAIEALDMAGEPVGSYGELVITEKDTFLIRRRRPLLDLTISAYCKDCKGQEYIYWVSSNSAKNTTGCTLCGRLICPKLHGCNGGHSAGQNCLVNRRLAEEAPENGIRPVKV